MEEVEDAYIATLPHPYGALPSGNAYFASRQLQLVRGMGLGPSLSCLSDETLGEVLSLLAGGDLARVLQTSRTLYCHASCGELWRDVCLRELGTAHLRFEVSWRDTFARTVTRICQGGAGDGVEEKRRSQGPPLPLHQPLRVAGVYSNHLFRPWSCCNFDFAVACRGFFEHSDIDRVTAGALSEQQFVAQYEMRNRPVVITELTRASSDTDTGSGTGSSPGPFRCPALTQWTPEYLAAQCGPTHRLRATAANASAAALFTMGEYFQYCAQAREEAPLYLFERSFAAIAPQLQSDYQIPRYFSYSGRAGWEGGISSSSNGSSSSGSSSSSSRAYETDLFRVLGEEARPDFRWFVAGPARSGSIFHIDPNNTNAWNLCIKGRKKWIFYPPGVSPPGVKCSPDGADVVVPISTGEWLLTFWKYHLEARKNPDPSKRPLEVILNPGEVIFVPHGYWHMVVNLEDSIALTHNYVSTSNLADVLRFLREKTDQISGVRDRIKPAAQGVPGTGTGAAAAAPASTSGIDDSQLAGPVAPEHLYDTFLRQLRQLLSPEEIDHYVSCSLQSLREDGGKPTLIKRQRAHRGATNGSSSGGADIVAARAPNAFTPGASGGGENGIFSFGFSFV